MFVRRTSYLARLFTEDREPVISFPSHGDFIEINSGLTLNLKAKIHSPVRGTAAFTNTPSSWTYDDGNNVFSNATGTTNIKVTWQFFTGGNWVDLISGFHPHDSTPSSQNVRTSAYSPSDGILTYSIKQLQLEDYGTDDKQYRVYVQGSTLVETTYSGADKKLTINPLDTEDTAPSGN